MKNIVSKLKNADSFFLVTMVLLGIWQVLRCADLPGLYLDAVNPDYLAVQILFPQTVNPSWEIPHTGLPLLGQLYHGTITMWSQILAIGLWGEASLLTLRFINIIYVIGICWIMYCILKKLCANRIISFLMIDAIILSPQCFSFIRTQYYIKLPGTLLLMLAMYFAVLSINQSRHALYLTLSGLTMGVSFYSYFIFLFFAPAVLVFCLGQTRQLGLKRFKDALIWCMSFGCGSILYVIGYTDYIITSSGLPSLLKKATVIGASALLLAISSILVCILVKKYECDKAILHCCFFVILSFLTIVIILLANFRYISATLFPKLSSLEIAGTSMGFTKRISQILYFWLGIMSNRFMEYLMLDTTSSFLPNTLIFLIIIVFGMACILTITRKMGRNDWNDILVWSSLLLCYGICCIPFISRMGGQHFTPIFFVTCMVFILLFDHIWSKICGAHIRKIIPILLGTFLIWGIINSNLLCQNLEFTGGKNRYSENINILAENALFEKKNGINTIYVFPEWGFMCGFNYLTMNQVPYILSVDTYMLGEYLNQGYQFKICSWDRNGIEQYIELLHDAGITNLSLNTMQTRDGDIALYILCGT